MNHDDSMLHHHFLSIDLPFVLFFPLPPFLAPFPSCFSVKVVARDIFCRPRAVEWTLMSHTKRV